MIKGTLNIEQRRIYDLIKDIISKRVLVEPMLEDSIMLSGSVISSIEIRDIVEKGTHIYYHPAIAGGKMAVYRSKT